MSMSLVPVPVTFPAFALSDVFLSPLGLAALAALVPLVLLYLIRPEPEHVQLPTLQFLRAGDQQGTDRPALERLRRTLLLLLQALVVVLVALALAGPYVTVPTTAAVDETAVVLDASASMQTTDAGGGSQSRFAAARSAAQEAVTSTTSVVLAGPSPAIAVRQGVPRDAERALAEATAADAGGDLSAAIRQATAIASKDARVVVFSDFAGSGDWRDAVAAARARGYRVDLRRVGGQVDNAGIVDLAYGRTEVTASVKNYGDERVTRTLRLGEQTQRLELAPGDVATTTFAVPPGNTELELEGRDPFPLDDTAYVAGPDRATVRVLLLTNDENRYLRTALEVLDEVELTVKNPPTAVTREYDVVVFSNVDRDRILEGTLQAAREQTAEGGGVVVQTQDDVGQVGYGDMLLVEPAEVRGSPSLRVRPDRLTDGITFPPPRAYVAGSLERGRPLVVTDDGSPVVATASLGRGRVLYYGYLEDRSSFKFNYQYPVFWKRAIYYAAGRDPLAVTNRRTGETLALGNATTVAAPEGQRETTSLQFDRTGFYRVGEGATATRYSASLLDADESNVTAPQLEEARAVGGTREERVRVPYELTPFVALGAIAVVLSELFVLRRRGDL